MFCFTDGWNAAGAREKHAYAYTQRERKWNPHTGRVWNIKGLRGVSDKTTLNNTHIQ